MTPIKATSFSIFGDAVTPGLRKSGWSLLQRVVDVCELRVEVGAEAVDDNDNDNGNAGGDQSVFDSGGAGLILHETRKKIRHL